MSGYQAPRFEVQAPVPQYAQPSYNYTLVEPEPMPRQVVAPAQPMWYPNFEVSAPIPMPQPVMAKVAIRNPEPMREPVPTQACDLASLPKEALIKALLSQLAREKDIESQ